MPPDEIPFVTDDAIRRELRVIVNALHDMEARVPSLAKRAEDLLRELEPRTLDDVRSRG